MCIRDRQYIPDNIRVIAQGEYVAESLKDYLCRHPEMDIKCTKNNRDVYKRQGAIKRYWRHGLFSNVQITAEKIDNTEIPKRIAKAAGYK